MGLYGYCEFIRVFEFADTGSHQKSYSYLIGSGARGRLDLDCLENKMKLLETVIRAPIRKVEEAIIIS